MAKHSQFRSSKSVKSIALICVLALPFAAIGTGVFVMLLHTIVAAKRMQAWPTVPGSIQSIEFRSAGTKDAKLVGKYSYVVNGQQLEGHKISLSGSDNIGNFNQNAFNTLDKHRIQNEPVPVHVNPLDPADAILLPVIRPEIVGFNLIFIILFGGAGFGLLTASFFAHRRLRAEGNLALQYPKQPWRHKLEWANPKILSTATSSAISAIVLAIVWNTISLPLLFALPGKLRHADYAGLLLLCFPLVGIGLIYWAVVSGARARKFGKTYIELDTYPARQGEDLRGRMYAQSALAGAPAVSYELKCIRNIRSSGSGKSHIEKTTIWNTKESSPVIKGESEKGDMLVKISIPLPADMPDSSNGYNEWITWELSANATLSGPDFEAEFELPVFKTA